MEDSRKEWLAFQFDKQHLQKDYHYSGAAVNSMCCILHSVFCKLLTTWYCMCVTLKYFIFQIQTNILTRTLATSNTVVLTLKCLSNTLCMNNDSYLRLCGL